MEVFVHDGRKCHSEKSRGNPLTGSLPAQSGGSLRVDRNDILYLHIKLSFFRVKLLLQLLLAYGEH